MFFRPFKSVISGAISYHRSDTSKSSFLRHQRTVDTHHRSMKNMWENLHIIVSEQKNIVFNCNISLLCPKSLVLIKGLVVTFYQCVVLIKDFIKK